MRKEINSFLVGGYYFQSSDHGKSASQIRTIKRIRRKNIVYFFDFFTILEKNGGFFL